MSEPRFELVRTALEGVSVVVRQPISDERGLFCRLFCAEELGRAGFVKAVAQVNQSRTDRIGAVRGLHFQYPPRAETKLVSCLKGEVFDVAVDLRRGSPTFLHWHAEILSEGNCRSVLIPEGFAHGFQALSPHCELLYLHSEPHAPESAGALNPADPALGVSWPLPFGAISPRDRDLPFIGAGFSGVRL